MTTASPTARSAAEALNRSARRILQAAGQNEWNSAVVDGAAEFARRAAVFTVQGSGAFLRLERTSAGEAGLAGVAVDQGRALGDALSSGEPVTAAWTASELSAPLVEALGPLGFARRAHLLPIAGAAGRSVALLLAAGEPGELDPSALELVAALAGAAWRLHARPEASNAAPRSASIQLVQFGDSAAPPKEPNAELHQRARRYAAVKVAEWRLYEPARVARGRAESNLYGQFQEEIDRERARFRAVFLEKDPTMVDYLHEEMIRTLTQGRAQQMGESYPGALERT